MAVVVLGMGGCPEDEPGAGPDGTTQTDDGGPSGDADVAPDDGPDSGPDSGPDVTPDTPPTDTPTDTPPTDTPIDTPADVPTDGPTDTPADTPADVPNDTPADVPTDVSIDIPPPPMNACLEASEGPGYQISGNASVRWKRVMALEADLLGALELEAGEACGEVGIPGICYGLHLVPLGGNEPVIATMYRPLPAPVTSTALAVDRVVVAACGAAVDRDTVSLDDPVIFKSFDLAAKEVTADTAGLDAVTTELFQRLLARDPSAAELALLATLTEPVDGVALSARDVAKLVCYSIATTTEFLFH